MLISSIKMGTNWNREIHQYILTKCKSPCLVNKMWLPMTCLVVTRSWTVLSRMRSINWQFRLILIGSQLPQSQLQACPCNGVYSGLYIEQVTSSKGNFLPGLCVQVLKSVRTVPFPDTKSCGRACDASLWFGNLYVNW